MESSVTNGLLEQSFSQLNVIMPSVSVGIRYISYNQNQPFCYFIPRPDVAMSAIQVNSL